MADHALTLGVDMIRRLTALVALGFVMAPVFAQSPPPLDPAALDLARLLLERDETIRGEEDLGAIRVRIAEQLLASNTCDPGVPDCRNLAATVAREFAEDYRESERVRHQRITAYLIADRLSPAQMAHVAQYLRGDEGAALLETLAMLREPERSQRRRREIERTLERTVPRASAAALAQFRQRARNVPAARPR